MYLSSSFTDSLNLRHLSLSVVCCVMLSNNDVGCCRRPEQLPLRSAPGHDPGQTSSSEVSQQEQLQNMNDRATAFQSASLQMSQMIALLSKSNALDIYRKADLQPESLNDAELAVANDIERLRG